MQTVLIVVHLMIVVTLVGVVLMQRSEGGALGMGGGGGGGNFMSARGAANALTRTTAILAAAFFATSIGLGILAGVDGGSPLDNIPVQNQDNSTGEGILDQLGGSDTLNLGGDDATTDDGEPQVPTSQ